MSTTTEPGGSLRQRRDSADRLLRSHETMKVWVRHIRRAFTFDPHKAGSSEAKEWRVWHNEVLRALEEHCSKMDYDDQEQLRKTCVKEEERARLAKETTHATDLAVLKDMVKHVDHFLQEAGLEARSSSPRAAQHTAHSGFRSPLLAEEMTPQADPDYDTFARSGYSANSLSKLPLGLTPRKARFYGFV